MQNVILIVHLLLALSLIGVVLLQRSEGGGLGMGGGGGGAMSQRSAGTALGKLTWALAIGFIATSLTLTIIAASDASGVSVMDRLTGNAPAATEDSGGNADELDTDSLLPPPSAGDAEGDSDAPLVPRAD
ncbi:preprotein translocase subunit SecG [Salipiger mucosus]|uniref:Protein-export membrane protein SecG n=1 Tax=Salipiger mucosus DSM 16094 TaxID=1123237 RepID=S9Q7G9_9RHOB|nr:preprotein translocase subunit SecG [Salipiger mucosus]EPX75977.1 Preprotein translocase subunit SecG [Salipiger mucosus DSM 16094]